MIVNDTPVEDHRAAYGLLVKREDLCCPLPGPPFSKTRGVYAHVMARPERVVGVLDTRHSQGGWAVARACQLLGKQCVVYYPAFKHENDVLQPREPQVQAAQLDALLQPLPAGRSAVLYHQAKKDLAALERHFKENRGLDGVYMMPNALKLSESVTETAAELRRTPQVKNVKTVLVSASSATIAAGVLKGLWQISWSGKLIVHLGYSRSESQVLRYMREQVGGYAETDDIEVEIVDEGYAYKDAARPGEMPPWACNEHYDLKAFRWWLNEGSLRNSEVILWNIG